MADNTQVTAGSGDVVRDKDRAGVKTQIVGIDLNIGGTESLMAGVMPVSDNGGSLTVDAPVGTPLRVDPTGSTTQPVSLAAVPTVTEKQDQPAASSATWTSATAVNTAVTVTTTGYGTANVSIQVPSTVTAGVISLEVSDDGGTTYYPAGAVRVENGFAENVVNLVQTAGTANNRVYAMSVDAFTQVRARLSTIIAGTGNVLVRVSTVAGGIEPLVATIPPRTNFALTAAAVATVSAGEAMLNTTAIRGFTTAAAAAQTTVTANKTLRITSITVSLFVTAAAVVQGFVALRIKASGTVAITDTAPWRVRMSNSAATANQASTVTVTFPDGIDLPSGSVLGLSHQASATTGIWDISVNGYEF